MTNPDRAADGEGAAAPIPPASRSAGRYEQRQASRPRGRLALFMALVCAVGLPLAAASTLDLARRLHDLDPAVVVPLVFVLVAGELYPIQVSRQGRSSDEITISTTFALALLLIAPPGVAVLAQSVPLVVDDVRRGKHWSRPFFNVAQYAVTFAATRAGYCLVSGQQFLHPAPFTQHELVPVAVAGAVFFLVNHGIVGTAVALWANESVVPNLRADLRFQVSTGGLLACLAPLVIVATAWSPLLLPVLLLPIWAVRRSAQLATEREHDALHDALTGLPNRTLLHFQLQRGLAEVARGTHGLAVFMVDLDHFKEINDTLGHHVGDLLIRDVADRLAAAAGDQALVARLGGDEFALLALAAGGPERSREAALALVERLADALRDPVTLAGVRLDVQASIGIALAPQHGRDIEELMARADVALYAAKETRGTWMEYDPDRDEHTPERLAMLAELRDGLGRNELVLHYQPKCATRGGEILGVEALVRWQHPTRGLLFPDEFIPVAENTGLISALTLEVLHLAVAQVRSWLDAGHELGVAVNLSVRHLTDRELPDQVARVLAEHDVPPHLLTLEVTEGTIMNDPSRAVAVLAGLSGLGVRLAVDDYGTGYSSLAYLKRLHVDELKIDKSFIMAMRTDENDAVIVRSTVELGHNLGLQVVAEGVEDVETWQLLLPLGCDVVQGYHLSRPLPPGDLLPWLASWQARQALAPALEEVRFPC